MIFNVTRTRMIQSSLVPTLPRPSHHILCITYHSRSPRLDVRLVLTLNELILQIITKQFVGSS